MRNTDVSGFWDGLPLKVFTAGVPERNAKFYVNWAHRFALSVKNVPLTNRSIDDINSFLKSVESQPEIRHCPVVANGETIRVVYELLGHKDIATTMIYTHPMN